MANKQFFIKYQEHQPVKIDTHFDSERKKRDIHLQDVADLVAAFQARPGSLLGNTDSGLITLHLPEDVDRSASGLDEGCFDSPGSLTLSADCPISSLGSFGSGAKKPLIIKSKKDKEVDSSTFEHFTVYHPSSIPAALLAPLKKLNSLLNNDAFFATFPLDASTEDLKQIFTNGRLEIRFVRSREFNDSIIPLREKYGEDVCCASELGWFDSRVSPNSVYINYDYCQTDDSNIQWLGMLIFITTMHELCHLLVHHCKVQSPTHTTFGEETTEAGECWELKNLGGVVNHAARPESPLFVKWLHTHTVTGDCFLSRTSIDQLDLIMNGQQDFPLNLDTNDEDVTGLQKFKCERHCVESPTTNRPFIPYTGPKLIKHQKKPDRKGPRLPISAFLDPAK